ncbi:MAG: hypothetical protein NTU51_02205 [Bacteroidetes bacterium]|nr:hypothetical protein [Bacteroidota bacterium]
MYPLVYHKSLSTEKWFSFPRHQQLLMIANEMNRAQNALLKNESDNAVHAWERSFELTDLTINDPKNVRYIKELLRFRELAGELFLNPSVQFNKQLMDGMISLDPKAYNSLV